MILNTFVRYFTPFIISVMDFINGVLIYMEYVQHVSVDGNVYKLLSITGGSSILVIAYMLATSRHMCRYYKCSCWILMFMHVISVVYIYTPIAVVTYIYALTVLSMVALVLATAAILCRKTIRVIRRAYRRV